MSGIYESLLAALPTGEQLTFTNFYSKKDQVQDLRPVLIILLVLWTQVSQSFYFMFRKFFYLCVVPGPQCISDRVFSNN